MTAITRRTLPVDRERQRICDKAYLNRVTLIVGGTGCGKSSQVPQMLLEELGGPILCTQPRRLAVVAVAKRVAEERGATLGEEVGYRIGQRRHYTSRTSIIFATAGVLLEDIRGQGLQALAPYKCIILDEVHERSVESDLVLTCLREFMTSHRSLRLVLMSATADIDSYERYFRGVLDGKLDRIPIPDYALSLRHLLLNTRVHYLEEAVKLAGQGGSQCKDMPQLYCSQPEQVEGRVGSAEQGLLQDLVVALHERDPDLSHAMLAFLPTYKSLETLHELLLATGLPLAVYALHSSIDVDDCLVSMEAAHPAKRKVVLATNIAESSVTIEGIYYVLDTCRTLQISWDREAQTSGAKIIWASKSQADQRKGRTGRTCDGVVYRLVPRRVYETCLPSFEAPAVTLLHLRREVLGLLCSESTLTNHPPKLLARCMDPPAPQVVQDALEHLCGIGAAEAKGKPGQFQPTPYGRFLGQLPVSLEAAQLVAAGGKAGLLRPAAVLSAILNTTPFPIYRPFASYEQYRQNLRRYFGPATALQSDGAAVLLANLAAFEFWQHAFHDPRRMRALRRLAGPAAPAAGNTAAAGDGLCRPGQEEEEGQEGEDEKAWCSRHALVCSSLQSIADLVQVILGMVHKHQPDFLPLTMGPPDFFASRLPRHRCLLAAAAEAAGGATAGAGEVASRAGGWAGGEAPCLSHWMDLERLYDSQQVATLQQVLSLRGVPRSALEGASISRASSASSTATLSSLYSAAGSVLAPGPERRQQQQQQQPSGCSLVGLLGPPGTGTRRQAAAGTQGMQRTQQPLCRFFGTAKGCSRGGACRFRHEAPAPPGAQLDPNIAELALRPLSFGWAPAPARAGAAAAAAADAGQGLGLMAFGAQHSVLVLGDGDLAFSAALAACTPARLMASVKLSHGELVATYPGVETRVRALLEAGVPLLVGMDATQLHTYGTQQNKACPSPQQAAANLLRRGSARACRPWRLAAATHLLWQFPFTGRDEDEQIHKRLMADFFASAAAAMLREGFRAEVLVTLCNDQFQRWGVEAAARESFFFPVAAAPFDASLLPGYQPKRGHCDEPFPLTKAITYALELHLPRSLERQRWGQ